MLVENCQMWISVLTAAGHDLSHFVDPISRHHFISLVNYRIPVMISLLAEFRNLVRLTWLDIVKEHGHAR